MRRDPRKSFVARGPSAFGAAPLAVSVALLLMACGPESTRGPEASGGRHSASRDAGERRDDPSMGGHTNGVDAGAGGSPEIVDGGDLSPPKVPDASGSPPETPDGGLPDDPLEAVTVIRGGAQSYWDLTVRGVALDGYEGKRVTVRIGQPQILGERIGAAQSRVTNGRFELFFPQVWEAGLYKSKLVYIDVDGDRWCTGADVVFRDFRAAQVPELIVRGRGSWEVTTDFSRSASLDLVRDCAYFNITWPRE